MFSLKTSMLKNIDVFQTSPNTMRDSQILIVFRHWNFDRTQNQKFQKMFTAAYSDFQTKYVIIRKFLMDFRKAYLHRVSQLITFKVSIKYLDGQS